MMFRFSKLARNAVPHPPDVSVPPTRPTVLSISGLQDDQLTSLIQTVRAQGGNKSLVDLLTQLSLVDQLQLLRMLSTNPSPVNFTGSILDSGSSRLLSPHTRVTHSDDVIPLSGFDDTADIVWTQGNGYLPLRFQDTDTNSSVDIDLFDADRLDSVRCSILSMGK